MSVHDAEPGDIYVDESGKLWRCIATCNEPTCTFEEIEPTGGSGWKERKGGGLSGLMWNGWKRIYHPDDPKD